jgi:hypothetical protein
VTGLLLIAAVSSNAIASSRDAKIARIERSLAHAGPAATLRKFFNCDNGIGWDLVSSGEQRAVKIAFALMPETDACYSEIMSVVLGRATSNNPELTLGYYAKFPKTFAEWCVPGLIGATDAEWKAAIDKAERAIRSVRNPALAKAREVCLAEVARARTMPPG